jgi:hypothetical protein
MGRFGLAAIEVDESAEIISFRDNEDPVESRL